MDLSSFIEKQKQTVKEVSCSDFNDLPRLSQSVSSLKKIVGEMRHFFQLQKFSSVDEELYCFKEVLPLFWSTYLYHKKMFRLNLQNSFSEQEEILKRLRSALRSLREFARDNHFFYEYCLSGDTYSDVLYFTSSASVTHRRRPEIKSKKLANILANEMLKTYLLDLISTISNCKMVAQSSLKWTTSKASLVELIYGLHASGCINHGNADIKQITSAFENLFSVDLGNSSKVFAEIRMRKNQQTAFIDQVKERLAEAIKRFDR